MRAVLFDVDGTLVKAGGSGRKALNRAVLELYGTADICSTISLAGRMDMDIFGIAFANATGKKSQPNDIQKIKIAYLQFLPEEVAKAVKKGTYNEIAGVSKLVKALARKKGVLLGLGTGNLEEGARIKLQPSGLLKYFQFGGFGQDAISRAQMLKVAHKRAESWAREKIRSKHVYAIGDTPRDVQAGRKAGFRTGAVLDGFGDAQAVRRSQPDFLAQDFRKHRQWLDWILK